MGAAVEQSPDQAIKETALDNSMADEPQTITSDSTEAQLPTGEGQNGTAPVPQPATQQAPPAPQPPTPQQQDQVIQQAKDNRDKQLDFHPAVTAAHVARKVGEAIAGGPRMETSIDPNTGVATRKPVPLSTKDILAGAVANILGGFGQVANNASARMGGRSPAPIQPLPTQQAQQQRDQQSTEDFDRIQQQKVRQAKVLEANMTAMKAAYAMGKEDDDSKDSVIQNHAGDLEQWQKSGSVQAQNIPSDQLMKKGFDPSKYIAIPDGRVPVINPDGKRVTDDNGVPLSQLTYAVVDGTTQTPLTQDKYDQFAKYGLMQTKQGFNLPDGATITGATLSMMNHKLDLINQTQRELDEVHEAVGGDKVDLADQIKKNPQMLSALQAFHNDAASTEPDNQINNLQAKNPQAAGLMRELFGNQNLEKFKEDRLARTKAEATKQETTARLEAEAATPAGQQKLANEKLTGEKNQLEIDKLKKDVEGKNWGDNTLSGQAYLDSLPVGQRSLIDELGKGKVGLNRLDYLVTRNPEVIEAVTRAYPGFDSTKVHNYIDTSKDFHAGKTSTELVAGGTALKHLSELKDLNTIESRIPGTADYQRFQNKLQTVAPELGRFYGNTTEPGIASYAKTLGALTNRDAAIETQAKSMGDRLDAYEQKWKNAAPSAAYQAPLPNIDATALKARAKLDPEYATRTKQQAQSKPPVQDKQTLLQSITLPGGGHPADLAYAKDGSLLVWSGKAGDGWVSPTGK